MRIRVDLDLDPKHCGKCITFSHKKSLHPIVHAWHGPSVLFIFGRFLEWSWPGPPILLSLAGYYVQHNGGTRNHKTED